MGFEPRAKAKLDQEWEWAKDWITGGGRGREQTTDEQADAIRHCMVGLHLKTPPLDFCSWIVEQDYEVVRDIQRLARLAATEAANRVGDDMEGGASRDE